MNMKHKLICKKTSDAKDFIIDKLKEDTSKLRLRPEYITKLKSIKAKKYFKYNSIEGLRKSTD